MQNALVWAKKNERRLGALLFTFGFLTDLLTFTLLPIGIINIYFLTYLVLAALSIAGGHALFRYGGQGRSFVDALNILLPLGLQYLLGGLLSGFVVFYAKNSVIAVSWPFLFLLAGIYIGNEYLRMYKHYLVFQTVLFFFALYAYIIFALPLFVGSIGPWIFIGSTLLATALFWGFLSLLQHIHYERLAESINRIRIFAGTLIVVIVASYFLGIIPPLPLVLKDVGIFHSLRQTPEGYLVESETSSAWWDFGPQKVHVTSVSPLYAFSAVAAPLRFSTTIVHHWERYEKTTSRWITEGRIAFPMEGGRREGYRGYTNKFGLAPGRWRVSIETTEGQVIGRKEFMVVYTNTPPTLETEAR